MHRTVFTPFLLALILALAIGCGRQEDKATAPAPAGAGAPVEPIKTAPPAKAVEDKAPAAEEQGAADEKTEDDSIDDVVDGDDKPIDPAVAPSDLDSAGGKGARSKPDKPSTGNKKAGARRGAPRDLQPQGGQPIKTNDYREEFGVEGKQDGKKDDKGNYREEFGVE